MKRAALTILGVILLARVVLAQSPNANQEFQTTNIVLYNQMDEFEARSPTAQVLGLFIKQLGARAAALWRDQKPMSGRNGFIAVAIRPDRTMKLSVDVAGKFKPEVTASLERVMKTIGVPQVKDGPIAFALHFKLCGGSTKSKSDTGGVQIPQLWQKAAKAESKALAIPDEILPLVWKAKPSQKTESRFFVPEGYDLQELRPTGGKILRPRGWFYTEGHRKHTFMWTISKEDSSKGPYETGVRIQCFAGVQEATGKNPKEVVQSFLDGKKKTAAVISNRDEQTQGLFTRVGLEAKEPLRLGAKQKPHRILYSCFWSNEADIVVIVISGTTTDLWEKHADAFDAMTGFDLIDMKRFEKDDRTKASNVRGQPRR
ncbi:MAG: hypothetical protein CMJ48_04710 [Planctomycetaceae bacterium]|nr:hypothetical protein [Planctomycetaceae bacterium]